MFVNTSFSDHYSAIQEGDMEPFDVTYLRDDRPQKAYLNNEFFPGFKMALASMKEKEVADFLIPPELACGTLGCAPRIQPNATCKWVEKEELDGLAV